jgi:hypothetical protein
LTKAAGLPRRFPPSTCKFATELGSIFCAVHHCAKNPIAIVVLGEDGKDANWGLDIAGDVEAFFAQRAIQVYPEC